ncbi:large-conductance mechanosensitive channel [Corynebacterium striatum]|uniref:Large-conductance mechanosensitive channel n=1 Tax=Corynebacterium striatum TaxID=43770 RepID=A0A2Z2J0S3_CORST|nr:large-conductance mechanosensitive channel protein MscL [Corynebacterium striatum]ART21682.1 large-conductance mechanosensitive channel [Corynebacterium striatum]HAT6539795.1 large-conductance mechanosensitive channel protein MscL [Corynebacterium striatum]HBC8574811.1 large-conductance mechanosensitive channel protein MscL [Corynebacterium striatum]HCG2961467.1 large-conductance mechanosensitive channel protein MscL [Corynebacterium striatum]
MLKGFKDFILRGNVIELAVAVIIGSAFTAIVTAVTDSLIQPLINSFGSAEVKGLGFQITDNESTFMDFGAVITAALNFLIIAAVVYFLIVMPINKITEAAKRRQGVDPEEPAPTTEQLLTEIRDLMEAQKATTSPNSITGNTTVDPDSTGRHQA